MKRERRTIHLGLHTQLKVDDIKKRLNESQLLTFSNKLNNLTTYEVNLPENFEECKVLGYTDEQIWYFIGKAIIFNASAAQRFDVNEAITEMEWMLEDEPTTNNH